MFMTKGGVMLQKASVQKAVESLYISFLLSGLRESQRVSTVRADRANMSQVPSSKAPISRGSAQV